MNKQTFTREEVIELIDNLLHYPDILIDAIQNEMTDWDGGELLKLLENESSEN